MITDAERRGRPEPRRTASGATARRRLLLPPCVLILALSPAACGSNLDPAAVGLGAAIVPAASAGEPVLVDAAGAPVTGDGATLGGAPGAGPESGPVVSSAPGTSTDPGAPSAPTPTRPGETEGPGPDREDTPPIGSGADCAGLKNTTGITDSTITIGNASDISGPVPGLMESAQLAVKAFVQYYNDSGATICGRSLSMRPYDTRTDASADQQAYAAGCVETFAMVGSMSGYDSGGAAAAEKCGIPDLRAITTTSTRGACATCYSVSPAGSDEYQNAVPDFIKRTTGGEKAAMLYLQAGAAAENGPSQADFGTRRGVKYVYIAGVDAGAFNYIPYVQAMKEKGVTSVQFVAANPHFVRLVQTMEQQNFRPDLVLLDPTAYSREFTGPGGTAAKGTISYLNFTPFEEVGNNPEVNLYLNYLERVKPGSEADFFGVFAWSAARLFVERATALGGDLTRESLIDSISKVKGWTGNDLHGPMQVGAKRSAECWRFVQWSGAAWAPIDGRDYQCRGLSQR